LIILLLLVAVAQALMEAVAAQVDLEQEQD
jgi:hypothetical protein